jgi:hypothetical protein
MAFVRRRAVRFERALIHEGRPPERPYQRPFQGECAFLQMAVDLEQLLPKPAQGFFLADTPQAGRKLHGLYQRQARAIGFHGSKQIFGRSSRTLVIVGHKH